MGSSTEKQETNACFTKRTLSDSVPQVTQRCGTSGVERTLNLLQERFYWFDMHSDTEYFVTQVC